MVKIDGLEECAHGIKMAAARDGVQLVKGQSFPWIGTRGPYGLKGHADSAFDAVMAIAVELGAYLDVMRSPERISYPGADLIHAESGVVIEVDEVQHFTSDRLKTFDHYPADSQLGFDIDEYRRLCLLYDSKAWRSKDTVTFGPKSRLRHRAFYDALKDLSIPASGRPPVVRIPVPDRRTEVAWVNARERVFDAIETAKLAGA